ncbi:MAG TPA: heme exporter protein CcmD [Phenylobacterium sp.]|jgi:heme exporter protein D|nr:heme exporter protein CcmD [Phenylobacterium sp.]
MPMPNLELGKYAAYIWPAYGITALVFAVLVVGALAHARRWRKKAEELTRK